MKIGFISKNQHELFNCREKHPNKTNSINQKPSNGPRVLFLLQEQNKSRENNGRLIYQQHIRMVI